MQRFKEVLSQIGREIAEKIDDLRGKARPVTLQLAEGFTLTVDDQRHLLLIPFAITEWMLTAAEREGIKPVSFRDIKNQLEQQLGPNVVAQLVLFDSNSALPGNHWSVGSYDEKGGTVVLDLCGIYGNYRILHCAPVTARADQPLFTGASVCRYQTEDTGELLSLAEVATLVEASLAVGDGYPDDVIYVDRTVFWSNREGVLEQRRV